MKKRLSILLILLVTLTSITANKVDHVHAELTVYCPLCGEVMTPIGTTNFYRCAEESEDIEYYCNNHTTSYTEWVTIPNEDYPHNFVLIENVPATCEADGKMIYECNGEDCGKRKIEPVSATGHNWDILKEATCTEDGRRICKNCKKQEVINKLGHKYEKTILTKATCTEKGVYEYKCTRCSDSYHEDFDALGHKYEKKLLTEATCTEKGVYEYKCSRCLDSYQEDFDALGHKYEKKVITKPTCTEKGINEYKCTRCDDKYQEELDALDHTFSKYEEKEATCLEDGYKLGTCTRCNQEEKVVIPALGHDWSEWNTTKESTCSEKGIKQRTCSRCNEIEIVELDLLPHTYPEEWTISLEPTMFKEGKKEKECNDCHEVIEETIPKNSIVPLVVGGVSLSSVVAGIFLYLKKKAANAAIRKTIEKGLEKELLDLSFKTRTIEALIDEEDSLFKVLKTKTFLEVSSVEDIETVVEDEPDLFIMPVSNKEEFDELIKNKEEELSEINVSVIAAREIYEDVLKQSVEDKKILSYVYEDESAEKKFVKCLLPVLKPDIKADESLENVGTIADALGIPGISTIINVYLSGKDIKEIVEAGDMGIVEKSDIVGDIASILGFETVEAITGFVDNIDSIKTAVETKDHGYEVKEGVNAVKDIVDTVKDNL